MFLPKKNMPSYLKIVSCLTYQQGYFHDTLYTTYITNEFCMLLGLSSSSAGAVRASTTPHKYHWRPLLDHAAGPAGACAVATVRYRLGDSATLSAVQPGILCPRPPDTGLMEQRRPRAERRSVDGPRPAAETLRGRCWCGLFLCRSSPW